jgi:RHS repeat-associated protein
VLATFSNVAGSAAVLGNQVYGPYGAQRYQSGSMGTSKGFTGQYNDSVSGLDYYHARYYDPVAAVFLSADVVQGNMAGMNPYDYVGGNPETWSDPTGQMYAPPRGGGGGGGVGGPVGGGGGSGGGIGNFIPPGGGAPITTKPFDPYDPSTYPKLGGEFPEEGGAGAGGVGVVAACLVSIWCVLTVAVVGALVLTFADATPLASGDLPSWLVGKNAFKHGEPSGVGSSAGEGAGSAPFVPIVGDDRVLHVGPDSGPDPCSFTRDTQVSTDHGTQSIGTLHVGEKVQAYNPKTHKMELQPILHVWKHTDNDLVDLTITTTKQVQHGKPVTLKNEVVHTTSEHPFLTTEKGFTPTRDVKKGMHVLRADGSVGVITGWRSVHGTKVMYNLEVAQDHTFTVGDGQWVVHNRCDSGALRAAMNAPVTFSDGQDAHHVIPCEYADHPLVTLARSENGEPFDMNGALNGKAMWDNSYMAGIYNQAYHSGNHPRYSRLAGDMLSDAYANLEFAANFEPIDPLDAYNALKGIISKLNVEIDRLGSEDPGCLLG